MTSSPATTQPAPTTLEVGQLFDLIRNRTTRPKRRVAFERGDGARLDLIQTKLDLQDQLASYDQPTDTKAVEDAFIAVAARYSTRKGISYTAWRQVGVPAPVLAKAGIPRTRAGVDHINDRHSPPDPRCLGVRHRDPQLS